MMAEPVQPQPPTAAAHVDDDWPRIPGYRIGKRLGRGGMATVYLATQESLDRPVSIKVMAGDGLADEVARQRFENEARTIARLSHPNIVAIHEVGRTDDGRMFYVMPYLPNGDLTQRDLRGDGERVAGILRALLSALGYAHARGIIHRDVKRENVLFDGDDRPLLADFGIALVRNDDTRLTTLGHAVGSTSYMSPEQARGEVVDGRTDLYAVGVLAYELLVGRLPFAATDALAMAVMHAQDPIPRLPAELRTWQAFIDQAMAKSRDARFSNASAMLQALDAIGQRQGSITGQVVQAVRSGGAGRSRMLFAAGAGVGVIALAIWYAHDRGAASGAQAAAERTATPTTTIASPATTAGIASGQGPTATAAPASAVPPASAASAASDRDAGVATADASPSKVDASGAASDASAPASKADAKAKRSKRPPPRRVKKRNFISRWWHNL